MKKLIVITIVLLVCQIVAIGQNWELFPKNQYSMFESYFDNQPDRLARFVKDSTRMINDTTIHYFNSKIINESNCSTKIDLNYVFERNAYSFFQVDSCIEKDNWYYFNYPNLNIQFKFNALAKVNESWEIPYSGIIFNCDSVTQQLVLGELDSVKYFSNNIAKPFVLSKSFGLIEFPSFQQFLNGDPRILQKVKLIGYEKAGLKKGFTVPDFSDFFHLKAGDVVFWHYDWIGWEGWPPGGIIDYYYKDSITNSTITADSVIYEITSFKAKSITKDKQSFYRDQFSRFLNIHTAPGIFTNENPMGSKSFIFSYWRCPRMERKDTIFSMDLQWGSLFIDPNYCTLNRLMDAGANFSFNTRVGLSAHNNATAVGSIINGEKWGITKIPTGTSTMEDASFKVYPNPCNDKIMIQSKIAGKFDYRLFNSNGQLVKAGQITDRLIDVSDLPNGLYNLQIGNDKMQASQKIVKVNKP